MKCQAHFYATLWCCLAEWPPLVYVKYGIAAGESFDTGIIISNSVNDKMTKLLESNESGRRSLAEKINITTRKCSAVWCSLIVHFSRCEHYLRKIINPNGEECCFWYSHRQHALGRNVFYFSSFSGYEAQKRRRRLCRLDLICRK